MCVCTRGIFSCLFRVYACAKAGLIYSPQNRCLRVPFAFLACSVIAGRARWWHASVLSKLSAFFHAKFGLSAGPIVACIKTFRQICCAIFQAYFDRWAGPIVACIYMRDKEKELSEATRFAKKQRDSGRSVLFEMQISRVLTFSCSVFAGVEILWSQVVNVTCVLVGLYV